jgi:hypothetical protein
VSAPLYEWEADKGERVTYDPVYRRIIHQTPTGVFAISPSGKDASQFIKMDCKGIESLVFLEDGTGFAFLCNNMIGFVTTLKPEDVAYVPLKKKPDDAVLAYFWLRGLDTQELVVVLSSAVEWFTYSQEQRGFKQTKRFPQAIRLCWPCAVSSAVVLCLGTRTLQPYIVGSRGLQQFPKCDLYITGSLQQDDVAVVQLYDQAHCLHLDSVHGRVSLRNISDPALALPEYDLVIEVGSGCGRLVPVALDNLLVIHLASGSLVFDTKRGDEPLFTSSACSSLFAGGMTLDWV